VPVDYQTAEYGEFDYGIDCN